MLASFFLLFFGFVFAAESGGDGAFLIVFLGFGGVIAMFVVGFFLLRLLSRKKPQLLVLEGNILSFESMEGPVRLRLEEVRAVDVVPVGLGIRPHRGPTHHILMAGASEAERVWLDQAIESARDRHGNASEVPDAIRELRD
jgi:hypothetical protein